MTERFIVKGGQKRYLIATYATREGAERGYKAMRSSGMISREAFIRKFTKIEITYEDAKYGLYA